MGLLLKFDPSAPTPSPEHLLSYLCPTSQLIHSRHLLMLLLFISIPIPSPPMSGMKEGSDL